MHAAFRHILDLNENIFEMTAFEMEMVVLQMIRNRHEITKPWTMQINSNNMTTNTMSGFVYGKRLSKWYAMLNAL